MPFATINSFYGEWRARSDCTYVQSDLALHSPLIYYQILLMKYNLMQFKSLCIIENNSACEESPCPLIHSHTNDTFWRVWERSRFKTLWEKEKMLVTSIFSLFHNVFYSIKDRNYHLCYIYFVVCEWFQFGQCQMQFVVWDLVNDVLKSSPCKMIFVQKALS